MLFKKILALLFVVLLVSCSVYVNESGDIESDSDKAVIQDSFVYDSCYVPVLTDPVVIPVPEVEEIEEPEEPVIVVDEEWATMLAKLVYREARGVKSECEQACVIWTVLNRIDDPRWGSDIHDVLVPGQFAYIEDTPCEDEFYDLAVHVLTQWELEKLGYESERVLPKEYVYFHGARGHNWFKITEKSKDYWDYSLPNPYES